MRRSNLGREFNNSPPENYSHPEQQDRVQPSDSKTDRQRRSNTEQRRDNENRRENQSQNEDRQNQPAGKSRKRRSEAYEQPAVGQQPAGNQPKKKKKRISHRQEVFLVVGVSLLLLVAMFFGARAYYLNGLEAKSTTERNILVKIPEGSSVADTAAILEENGVIKNAIIFQSYVGTHSYGGQSIQAADYLLSPTMTVPEIYTKLVDGDAYHGDEYQFTIPEGKNIEEMSTIIADTGICTADEFKAETKKLAQYMKEYPILDSIPSDKVSERTLEGYLFPDTYDIAVPEGTSGAEQVCDTMLQRFTDVFTQSMIDEANSNGHTVDDIVIMASIVELETKLPEDRKDAASVFYNRIAQDMPLQSDITVDYALGTKTPVLTTEQVQSTDSPYNTYLYTGLPLGPICSPGLSSIEAALEPSTTDYLYFVADMDTGKLHFNTTLEGHKADVEKYMSN